MLAAVPSANFIQIATPWILSAEGGFTNRAADRGGVTSCGWSINTLRRLPDHDGDGFLDGDLDHDGDVDVDDIRALTPQAAAPLYHTYFWEPDRLDELPPAIALCLFDGLVHHGPRTARMLVQKALAVLVDGDFGPQSRAAARRIIIKHFLPDYLSYRALWFSDFVHEHPDQAEFERGWYRRLFLLQRFILENVK